MRIKILIFITFLSIGLKAEYDGLYLHFEIENFEGENLRGYLPVDPYYINMDSIKSTYYLKQVFASQKHLGNDLEFGFFQDKISYSYIRVIENQEKNITVDGFINDTLISLSSIKKASIIHKEHFSYCSGSNLVNHYGFSDTVWFKNEPKKVVHLNGYLSFYEIHFFDVSPEMNKLILNFEAKEKELRTINFDSDGSGYSEDGFKIDQEIGELIKVLDGQKVVVILHYDC